MANINYRKIKLTNLKVGFIKIGRFKRYKKAVQQKRSDADQAGLQ